jgi:hypothetical protein
MTPDCPLAPVSWGELLDKITILQIKRERIGSEAARANVVTELRLLEQIAAAALHEPGVAPLQDKLKIVNEMLWEIEDEIRIKEGEGDFGDGFVALARSVYKRNDERAALKREINALLGSALVEEKSYAAAATTFLPVDAEYPGGVGPA